jgi:hypothetical protein
MTDEVIAVALGAVMLLAYGAVDDYGRPRWPKPVVGIACTAVFCAVLVALDTVSDTPLLALVGIAAMIGVSRARARWSG